MKDTEVERGGSSEEYTAVTAVLMLVETFRERSNRMQIVGQRFPRIPRRGPPKKTAKRRKGMNRRTRFTGRSTVRGAGRTERRRRGRVLPVYGTRVAVVYTHYRGTRTGRFSTPLITKKALGRGRASANCALRIHGSRLRARRVGNVIAGHPRVKTHFARIELCTDSAFRVRRVARAERSRPQSSREQCVFKGIRDTTCNSISGGGRRPL